MGKHSFLSASASHRWINCPPSARLCEEYADRPSEYAQEGTDCHELCAYKVEKALGRSVKDPTENLTYYSQEMEDCADGYCAFVMEEVLAPAAKLAYEGKGEFKAGDHCQFCKAKANCRKRAEYNLELARYDFEMPALLGDDEVAAILTKADELVSWAGDVKDYALLKALSGTKFTGFKVVEGRSNRKYTDEDAVAKAVEDAGYEPYEKRLLGITAMSQALGRKKFEELLGGLVYKPPGKPVLVPESDKRPAMNTAINDFKENEEDNNYGKDRK